MFYINKECTSYKNDILQMVISCIEAMSIMLFCE